MNIISHGVDIVECERIATVLQRHRERFLHRVLTTNERRYCERHKNPVPRIAGRFAAKEAILKVLGTGWRGEIAWTDMEILNHESGQPAVTLTGHCATVAERLGIARIILSISHTENHAIGSAIGVGP